MKKYVETYQLDARPDRIDLRDRSYHPPLISLSPEFPSADYVRNYFSKYKSLVVRRGKKRALIAIGHKSLCSVYHILSKKEPYKELGAEFLEKRKLNNRIKNINSQLKELGYEPVEVKKKIV